MKEFEGKRLLVLGAVKLSGVIVEHAKAMGAYVIVADYKEDSPAKKYADEGILLNAVDVDAIVDYCRKANIDGIATGFIDILLEPCYKACQILGLPCFLTPKLINMSTNKIEFKDTCRQFDVPVPKTYFVGSEIPNETYANIEFPVFVKPLDSSGSRGAGVCNNIDELNEQFSKAIVFSPTKNVVVEEYLIGREFLLNYVAQDGNYRIVSMFDRYTCSDRGTAINYSNLAIAPSKGFKTLMQSVNDKVEKMFSSLGFKDGIFFLQGYHRNGRITFFEMGCRLGGSYYNLEKACINIDPVDLVVRYALSGKMMNNICEVPKWVADYKTPAICINYLLKDCEATIGSIIGLKDVVQYPTCDSYEQMYFVGDHFSNDRMVDRPILSLYLVEESMTKAIADVEYLNEKFHVFDADGNNILKEKFDLRNLLSIEI